MMKIRFFSRTDAGGIRLRASGALLGWIDIQLPISPSLRKFD